MNIEWDEYYETVRGMLYGDFMEGFYKRNHYVQKNNHELNWYCALDAMMQENEVQDAFEALLESRDPGRAMQHLDRFREACAQTYADRNVEQVATIFYQND